MSKFYRSDQLVDINYNLGDGDIIRMKITSPDSETKWLNISSSELDKIINIIRSTDNGVLK